MVGRSFLDEEPQGDEKSDGRETDDVPHDSTSPSKIRDVRGFAASFVQFAGDNMPELEPLVKIE